MIEFQTEPDSLMFGRILTYAGLTWLQEKPTDLPGDRFQLLPVVVNLTGIGQTARTMIWRPGAGTSRELIEWNMQALDAAAVLAQVAAGKVARVVLAWVPLMQRGGEADILRQWLEIAAQEPDPSWRDHLALARVFAPLTNTTDVWNHALEGFNMKQSAIVNEWKAEGKAKGKAETVRQIL